MAAWPSDGGHSFGGIVLIGRKRPARARLARLSEDEPEERI
jgi:hypothetical protein